MFELPPLPYGFGDLAPAISEETLRTHYSKHHKTYVEKTNALLAEAAVGNTTLEDVIRSANRAGEAALFQNAAQAWNHAFYWDCMRPTCEGDPKGAMAKAINDAFGDLAGLRKQFVEQAGGHFGSGWAWILADRGGGLKLWMGHDATNPIVEEVGKPLLVCDLWEHAYYLDYKNKRPDYLQAWFDDLADWGFAQRQYDAKADTQWRYPNPNQKAAKPINTPPPSGVRESPGDRNARA
jgi:superoxide dismutase, Fe-Mn family